jgi:hypothetical protein
VFSYICGVIVKASGGSEIPEKEIRYNRATIFINRLSSRKLRLRELYDWYFLVDTEWQDRVEIVKNGRRRARQEITLARLFQAEFQTCAFGEQVSFIDASSNVAAVRFQKRDTLTISCNHVIVSFSGRKLRLRELYDCLVSRERWDRIEIVNR